MNNWTSEDPKLKNSAEDISSDEVNWYEPILSKALPPGSELLVWGP